MTLSGVQHVALNVGDLEAAKAFYLGTLGLQEIARPDFGIPGLWMDCGGTQIHLVEVGDHDAPDGQHFAFEVDDIDATIAELRGKAVDVTDPFDLPGGGGRQAFLKDPSGNLLELNQPN